MIWGTIRVTRLVLSSAAMMNPAVGNPDFPGSYSCYSQDVVYYISDHMPVSLMDRGGVPIERPGRVGTMS